MCTSLFLSRTLRVLSLVPLLAVVASCHGGKGASGPASNVTSSLDLKLGANALQVKGPAFARIDPSRHALVVSVFAAGTDPAPSCDLAADSSQVKKGGVGNVQIALTVAKTGTFVVGGGGILSVDTTKGDMMTGGGMLSGATIDIKTFDSSTLVAHIVTSGGGDDHATGDVTATVCP
jgi:hypothetical protein